MIKPLNNNCLIEVIDENEGLVGGSTENVQKGVLRDYLLTTYHLTASAGYNIGDSIDMGKLSDHISGMKDKTVYWQEYADSGSKFDIDGKQYVLVPFYRLIGFEE